MKSQSVPLVGGYYADESRSWSSQDCVNWLPTQAEKEGTRTPGMLKTPPGLRDFFLTSKLTINGKFSNGQLGIPYNSSIYIYGGGGVYSNPMVTDGVIPDGLHISIDGNALSLSGTPSGNSEVFDFTVSVDSSDGQSARSQQSISMQSINYYNVVMSQSPNAYWRFGETSGTIAKDEFGLYPATYQTNGVTIGTPSLVTTDINHSVTSSGNDAIATIANSLGIWSPQDVSISCLIKMSSLATESGIIWGTDDPNYGTGISVNTNGGLVLHYKAGQGQGSVVSSTGDSIISVASIYHICLTLKLISPTQTSANIYVNGVSVFSNTEANRIPMASNHQTNIGSWLLNGSVSNKFKGTLDELAVFPRALSSSEIAIQASAR